MDNLTILNYMGSKKGLIGFIHSTLKDYVTENDTILDIFAGTCAVGYSYKKTNAVYANDIEKYSAYIAKALLGQPLDNEIVPAFLETVQRKYASVSRGRAAEIDAEERYLKADSADELIGLYSGYKTVWNDEKTKPEPLFLSCYASNYFGIRQAAEIDAIRAAIDEVQDENAVYILFSCLFYAMKECVFAKDGHMAQPLELQGNRSRLLAQRKKSIVEFFRAKTDDFRLPNFCAPRHAPSRNKVYNLDFEQLLNLEEIKENVSVIYADPPYTDMQYSRYYHLLNTVIENRFSEPTVLNGSYTKGLYFNNRYQSKLSQKNTCLGQMEKLIAFSSEYDKTLVISFGFPQDAQTQKTDRYVLDISELIAKCKEHFGDDGVNVQTVPYEHSNNRNSTNKKVLEYLIVCKKSRFAPDKIERVKERIKNAAPSKNNALYNSHIYWAQKPFNICDILIEEFSKEGDTVFDPFLGSGVTLLEAVKNQYRRKAIGCEINQAPVTIVKTLLRDYDLADYSADASVLVGELRALDEYYQTTCPKCGGTGIIHSVTFDRPERTAKATVKKISYECPVCKKAEKSPDERDIAAFERKHETSRIANQRLHENTKLAVYRDERIADIFTPRNFKVLDEILRLLERHETYQDVYKYILMSVLHLCKITDTHSNSQWPLWTPKTGCVEKNAVHLLCNRIEKFKSTIKYIKENYSAEKDYLLLQKGSQYITEEDIPNDSVHLIVTDPPYLGQVAYSEYMQLYRPFLGYEFNLDDEIIVTSSPERKKTLDEYFDSLDAVFGICDRKMKEGGYFCMYFHDCSLNVWNRLIGIMSNNHFKYLTQTHVGKTNTLKNIISPKKSLSGDAILIFVKDSSFNGMAQTNDNPDEIEANVLRYIEQTVRQKGPQTTPELYDDGLIEYLIYNGWLERLSGKYKTLVELFEKRLIWNSRTSKWSLE